MKKTIGVLLVALFVVLVIGTCVMAKEDRVELVNFRDMYHKVFANADGTTTYEYAVNPMHYLNDQHQWENIDCSLKDIETTSEVKERFEKDFKQKMKDVADAEGGTLQDYNKGVTSHMFKLYLPKKLNRSIYFEYNDFVLAMKPLNVLNNQNQSVDLKHPNEITYTDVWYKTDLKYEVTNTGLKEYINLNGADAEKNISFFIKGNHFDLKFMPSGEIGAYDRKDNKLIFVIPLPTMWDANNVYCDDISYHLTNSKNGYILTLVPNQDYLHAPDRAFPVTIDPDIIVPTNTVEEKTYIDSDRPTSVLYTDGVMQVGHYKKWNFLWIGYHWEKRVSLLRFLQVNGSYPVTSDVNITKAEVRLYSSYNSSETTNLFVNTNADSSPDWNQTTVNWNLWDPDHRNYTSSNMITVAREDGVPNVYRVAIDTISVKKWMLGSDGIRNKGLSIIPDWYKIQDNLKKFSNAVLDVTINQNILGNVNYSFSQSVPQTVNFTSNITTSIGPINYSWDFDIFDQVNDMDTRPNPTHTYQTPGPHTYKLTVTAYKYVQTFTGTIDVPETNFHPRYGDSSDPQNLVFEIEPDISTQFTTSMIKWDFGDGSYPAYGRLVRHKFPSEGTYNVSLTITDTQGMSFSLTKKIAFYKPLILIHGYGDDYSCWDDQVDYIKETIFNGDMQVKKVAGMDANTDYVGMPIQTVFNFDYYRLASNLPQFMKPGKIGPLNTGSVDDVNSVKMLGTGGLFTDPDKTAWTYGNDYSILSLSYSEQLNRLVERICANTGFSKVDIVAHSMGGLVTRSYIKYYKGNNRVDHLLTVGTPNHGIRAVDAYAAANFTDPEPWQSELEIREMASSSKSFYTTDENNLRAYVDILDGDSVSLSGELYGCNNHDTIGPTRYATIAGTDNGEVNVPVLDVIWEFLAPDDGVIEEYSVKLHGDNVDANLNYPGVHSPGAKGGDVRTNVQIISKTPFIASYVNAWMHQKRLVNPAGLKPASTVTQISTVNGPKVIVNTATNRDYVIWVWVVLQKEIPYVDEDGNTQYVYTFYGYNSLCRDFTNPGASSVFEMTTAHYQSGDKLRVAVLSYGTTGLMVEYLPIIVQ